MKATALIPLARTLRVDSRAASTYALRGALVFAVFLGLIVGHQAVGQLGAPGRWFFSTTAYITFFFITGVVLSYFAAVIAEEKDQRTLSLLLLTGMSPVSILLGKSTSRLLAALFLLALQIPFAILAIPLGGISLDQILATYCTLAAHFFFLTSVALWCSVVASTTRAATTLTGVLLLLFFLGPILGLTVAQSLVSDLGQGHWIVTGIRNVCERWRAASAFNHLREILTVGYQGGVAGYQVISNLVGGVVFFGLAWACFGPANREERNPGGGAPARAGVMRRRRGHAPVWRFPLAWKDFYFLVGGPWMWFVQLFLVAFAVGVSVLTMELISTSWSEPMKWAGRFLLGVAGPLFALELAFVAGRTFREEIRWRTLPALAMLPMSTPQIAYQKAAGSLLGALPPVACFFLGGLLAPEMFAEMLEAIVTPSPTQLVGYLYVVAGVVLLVHLTAFLSLWMRHGALIVSLAVAYIGKSTGRMLVGLIFGFLGDATVGLALVTVVLLVFSAFLHVATGRRLAKVAAQ